MYGLSCPVNSNGRLESGPNRQTRLSPLHNTQALRRAGFRVGHGGARMDPHVAPGNNRTVQMRDILNVVAERDQEGPGDVSDVLVHIDRCASAREVPEHLAGLQTARQHDMTRTETAVT